jgi:hypothetical protein
MKTTISLSKESGSIFDIDDDKDLPFSETFFYLIKYHIDYFFHEILYGFQKLIRPYHAFVLELR